MLVASLLFAAGAIAAPAVISSTRPSPRPTVTLANGVVVGTSIPGVDQYLGIPFAQSPPLRFAPPQPASSWSSPLDASKLPPACIQQFDDGGAKDFEISVFNNPLGPPLAESEDCLYVNVYAPQTKTSDKAVMAWIFGGNLQFGSGSLRFYNGSSFAKDQDVILVTMNYRTNGFGFSNSPEIALGSQNAGFLDQRMALQWIQQNIFQFGGNPAKVTIFGESAGGYSVKQLLANPPSPLTFRAAIMQSEAAAVIPDSSGAWEQLVSAVNCTTAVSQLACVRQVPALTVQNAMESNGIDFQPAYDGVTAVSNVLPIFATKRAAQVPILIGTNANEGTVFAKILLLTANITLPDYVAQFVPPAAVNAVAAAFSNGVVFDQLSNFITQYIFQCAAKVLSETATNAGYNVWRYYYEAYFPNTQPFDGAKAYHSSEIPEVFNNYPTNGATAQEIALGKYMSTIWATFAKNPGSPGWASVAEGVLQDLGNAGSGGGETIATSAIDQQCTLLDPLIIASGP